MSPSNAIATIEDRAVAAWSSSIQRWEASGLEIGPIEDWSRRLARAGRLTVNFHPDRPSRSGHDAAAGLAIDGRYDSQWTTGTSAGSCSAIDGGERQRFERDFFAGVYQTTAAGPASHPVYGALDLLVDDHGGSPRFGSCYLVLEPHVRNRATLSLGDSHLAPRDVGTFLEPSAILAGLAEQARRGRLLDRRLGRVELIEALEGQHRSPVAARDLDGYVEAQIHGGISLEDDAAEVVLDPSFRGTSVERNLTVAADRFGMELRWHSGSELHIDDVPADFRGATMPSLAARVARPDGIVDAAAIGRAAASAPFEEPTPLGDPPDAPRQQLKYLWHTVLANGSAARSES